MYWPGCMDSNVFTHAIEISSSPTSDLQVARRQTSLTDAFNLLKSIPTFLTEMMLPRLQVNGKENRYV
ncbi:unnamed protein product [Heterobilharzia americana]|nr:unnamed protein product [Heterobilharzia americana]CAH8461721.1 unnamed protein product [Heterobilharzia americana]